MKQIKDEAELIGKTILRTAYLDNKYFLFFTDDTFCIFSDTGCDEKNVELNTDEFDTEPNMFNFENLDDIDLIDKETYEKFHAIRKEIIIRDEKNQEIKLLNNLRKKYPDA